VERAIAQRKLARELKASRTPSEEDPGTNGIFRTLHGGPQPSNAGMCISSSARWRCRDATVLVRVESGTGKELVVNAVHSQQRPRERTVG
jgi:DNA-binding NtrC family response regulator